MKNFVATLLLVAWFLLFPILTSAQKQAAEEELKQGIKAYKEARYDDAIVSFKLAVDEDSTLLNARMYLATAYSQQYVPSDQSPENMQIAKLAIEQYRYVLKSTDPAPSRDQRINSAKGVAGLFLQMKNFDEAKQSYQEATAIDPADPENYYSIGVIDWTRSFQPRAELRAKLGMSPTKPLIHNPACWQLKSQNEVIVKDGVEKLTQAIKLRPDYDDAMAYMNLMIRERADIQCGNDRAYKADMKVADDWVDLVIATKQSRSLKIIDPANTAPQN